MIALALVLQAASLPPPDWSDLPPVPWRVVPRITPELAAYVAGEVAAGRCAASVPHPDGTDMVLSVPIAVELRGDASVGRIIPRAIDCPTVEQFAAGFVSRAMRGNLRLPVGGWYVTTVTFVWAR